nr:hypothetical protein [Tanacetum cinerariifolium]
MQTRSSSKFVSESSSNPISTNSKHRNRRRSKQRVESFSIPIVTMAGNRTMEKMLQAPTKGYGDAIVVPDILAENFEIRTGLLSLIQANQFHGFESDIPHDHIRSFNRITSTLKFRDVTNDAIKLMPFPYSLEGAAKIWCEKEPPRSILTWGVSNTVTNPRGDLKAITTQSGVSYDGPPIPPPTSSLPKEVERVPEVTKDTIQLTTTPVNENCSAVILKKLPEKLEDLGKFLIPCDFSELDECLLVDLAGIAKDVFVKVGNFHFPTDFVVVDYVVDPRIPLILERPFLRTGRALIDVYGKELTLRVDDEAITFNVGQTSKYSYNDVELINQIDVIDVAYPIIYSSSPSFTPFEGSDFILEEIETFLQTPDEISNLDDDYYDTEGDILYLEKLLNDDPSPNLPLVKTEYLKQVDATMTKPSIEEPLELELKELLSHLEYAFLEGTNKLPVIFSNELKYEGKCALLKVLKSHKRAITWKFFEIKGIDPCFYTHKILMEDDFKPAVQHQRRVNPKIHEVIKNEVIKLLDVGLIYLISDSLWVSLVHCVPKKGGMT